MKRIILTSWIALTGILGAQDMPLSQVLIPGEDWRLASFRHEFTDAPTADAKGNFYFSDLRSEQGLYQIIPQGKVVLYLKGMTGISGMKFGPDGKIYACRARTRELVSIDPVANKLTVLAKDVRPNDLVVTHKGYLYFTETPKKQVTFYNTKTGKMKAADVGITAPNGICLSPDQGTLVVSDFRGKHCWAFRIEMDGTLAHDSARVSAFMPWGRHDHGRLWALLRGHGVGGTVFRSDRSHQRRDSGATGHQRDYECDVWRIQHGVLVHHLFRQDLPYEDAHARHCVSGRAAGVSAEEKVVRDTSSELARAPFWFWRANISDRS